MRLRSCAVGALGVAAVLVGLFALVACLSQEEVGGLIGHVLDMQAPTPTSLPNAPHVLEKKTGLGGVVLIPEEGYVWVRGGDAHEKPKGAPDAEDLRVRPIRQPVLTGGPRGVDLPVPPVSPRPPAGKPRLHVVLTWDHPCDVDLHVVEPDGQKCWYNNRTTRSGGTITPDVTNRTGPEVYNLGQARLRGLYRIFVAYYAGQGPVRATVEVRQNIGDPNETLQTFTIPMAQADEGRHLYPVTEVYIER